MDNFRKVPTGAPVLSRWRCACYQTPPTSSRYIPKNKTTHTVKLPPFSFFPFFSLSSFLRFQKIFAKTLAFFFFCCLAVKGGNAHNTHTAVLHSSLFHRLPSSARDTAVVDLSSKEISKAGPIKAFKTNGRYSDRDRSWFGHRPTPGRWVWSTDFVGPSSGRANRRKGAGCP